MSVRVWSTPRESLDQLVTCARQEVGSPTWWACLAGHLDELRDELATADIEGLAAQITADGPHLASPGPARRTRAWVPRLHPKHGAHDLGSLNRLVADPAGTRPAAPQRVSATPGHPRRAPGVTLVTLPVGDHGPVILSGPDTR